MKLYGFAAFALLAFASWVVPGPAPVPDPVNGPCWFCVPAPPPSTETPIGPPWISVPAPTPVPSTPGPWW